MCADAVLADNPVVNSAVVLLLALMSSRLPCLVRCQRCRTVANSVAVTDVVPRCRSVAVTDADSSCRTVVMSVV